MQLPLLKRGPIPRLPILPTPRLPPTLPHQQAFAAELATLLQLQLPRLTPPTLAAVVHAVGCLDAAPKPAWVEAARVAAERAARRLVCVRM